MKLLILCASDHLNLKLAKRIESKATDFKTTILNLVELDLCTIVGILTGIK